VLQLYQCFSPGGLLDEATRRKVAEEITRIHCDATGVPVSWVNVMFIDVPAGQYFVGGKPAANCVLSGAIRAGHDVATRQRMLQDLSAMWARVTGQPEQELLVTLRENPPENAMEAGSIFPPVGHEPPPT
jgi:phenylpyruvate tautomerase PptA (4-oxalocrotonate tautomerase family)